MSDPMHFLATLREDLDAARRRDPAARSLLEVALAYPGVHAVWTYRLAHRMWRVPSLRLPARLFSQFVVVGAGAKILGPVWIGAGAQIGANAVVIHDVPPGGIAVGVPAKIRLRPATAPFDAEIDDPAIYI